MPGEPQNQVLSASAPVTDASSFADPTSLASDHGKDRADRGTSNCDVDCNEQLGRVKHAVATSLKPLQLGSYVKVIGLVGATQYNSCVGFIRNIMPDVKRAIVSLSFEKGRKDISVSFQNLELQPPSSDAGFRCTLFPLLFRLCPPRLSYSVP